MSSPSARAHTTRLDAVDLTSLTLGVPASDASESKNIFAFGSSSTWGATGGNKGPGDAFSTSSTWGSTTGNNGGSGNWGVLGGASTLGAVTEPQDKAAVAATSFLSLSSTNTWGTTGLFGSDHGTTAD